MNNATIQYNRNMVQYPRYLLQCDVCGVVGMVDNRNGFVCLICLIIVYSVLIVAQCVLHK